MTIFRLKQFASTSIHAAADAMHWNYDRAELIADGVVHIVGVCLGLIAATTLIVLTAVYAGAFEITVVSVYVAGLLAIALLIGVWCVAIAGVVLKLVRPGRYDRLAVGLYLALGWSGVTLYDAVVKAVPPLALGFLLAGGGLYSCGGIFHSLQRLRFQNA